MSQADLLSSVSDWFWFSLQVNPIEYGHIYLVPYKFYNPSKILDKESLEYINEIAIELDDCFFRMFYDYAPLVNPSAVYFQVIILLTSKIIFQVLLKL